YIPGMDAAGVVASIGEGVSDLCVGQRIAWAMAPGAYADRAVAKACVVVRVPDTVSTELAASRRHERMAAYHLTHSVYQIQEGATVLVHAAAGGTGLLITQLAKERGARVIGTVSTQEKERVARDAGADEIVHYTKNPVAEAVRDLTNG